MMEAIQGEGGVIPLDKDFVQEVVKYVMKKIYLVIFDEVQCGIARTGKMFGYNNFDVEADIVTVLKVLGGRSSYWCILCNKMLQMTLNQVIMVQHLVEIQFHVLVQL